MPAAVATFLIGVSSFAALGMALAAVVKSASSASAAANAIILPLAFVSDVFVQVDDPPRWLEVVGSIFPLKPFVQSFQACFNPTVDAPAFDWAAMAFVALWGLAGLGDRAQAFPVGAERLGAAWAPCQAASPPT